MSSLANSEQAFNRFDNNQITVVNPKDRTQTVGAPIPFSTMEEIEAKVTSADAAFKTFSQTTAYARANFLENIVTRLEDPLVQAEIVTIASQETPYNEARIKTEISRSIFTLKGYVELLRSGEITIEHTLASDSPNRFGPPAQITQFNTAVGVAVDFESSNFPVAFGVLGNNPIAALACGCPVVFKVHELHAGTSKYLADLVVKEATKMSNTDRKFSSDIIQLVYGGPKEGQHLVMQPAVKAVTITGSAAAGNAIEKAIGERPDSRSVRFHGEYGGQNPICVLDTAIDTQEKRAKLAKELFDSNQLWGGMFCTNPGMILIDNANRDNAQAFTEEFKKLFLDASYPTILSDGMVRRYNQDLSWIDAKRIDNQIPGFEIEFLASGKDGVEVDVNKTQVKPVLLKVAPGAVHHYSELRREIFGPQMTVCELPAANMVEMLKKLGGQLAIAAYSDAAGVPGSPEEALVAEIEHAAQHLAGVFRHNQVPTGITVSKNTRHTGEYPASSDSRRSSVGFSPDVWAMFQITSSTQGLPRN